MPRRSQALALALAAALVWAACGGDDTSDPQADDVAGTTQDGGDGVRTAPFRGVTADAVKVGIVLIDYPCIRDFIDFNRGDQRAVYEALVDELNDSGGIHGRTIDAVYSTYCPIGNAEALSVCTSMTDDEAVFAVLGVFIDFSGDAQLCLVRDHETIHVGHELEQRWIDDAPPGLMVSPEITRERRVEVLFPLLAEEGLLDGRTVAVLSDDENAPRARDAVVPAIEDLGVDLGSTAILEVAGTDTTAAHAQLDSFIERWKGEGVDAIVIAGLSLSARQWVEKIARELPDAIFVVDSPSSAVEAGRDAQEAGIDPNPYEQMYAVDGESLADLWDRDLIRACVRTVEDRTGTEVTPPDEAVFDADGKRVQLYVSVMDACSELEMFRTIAERAGTELTNETWTAAVHEMGDIELPNTRFASVREGKYDADDAFRLVRFDGSLGDAGDWRPLGDVIDVTP